MRTRTRLGCGLGVGLSYTIAALTSFDVTTTVLMVVVVMCYLNAADVVRLSGAWQIWKHCEISESNHETIAED